MLNHHPSTRRHPGWSCALLLALLVAPVAGAQSVAPTSAPAPADPAPAAAAPQAPVVFTRYEDVAAAHPDQLVTLTPTFWGTTAYALFKSHTKLLSQLVDHAVQAGQTTVLVINDRREYFPANAPPQGFFMGGDYYQMAVVGVGYVPMTADALLSELKAHMFTRLSTHNDLIGAHVHDLLVRMSDPAFAAVVPTLTDFVRDPKADDMDPGIAQALIQAIAAHPAPDLDASLLRWAKYHKNAVIRENAMLALIHDGHRADVDALMASEADAHVKDVVGRALL